MFGRKKKTKKQDLDWQPSMETSRTEDLTEQSGSFAPDNQARYTTRTDGAGGDTWAGLIHPLSIFRFIFGNLRFIMTIALVVVIGGLAVYFVMPDKYGTTALILVDPRQPRVTSSETVLSGIGGDAAALTSYVEVMNSDGFLSKVVDELNVKADPDFAKAENKTELIGMFRENMSAYRQGATYIVEVYYKSKNKENAAKYANGVAEAFIRDQKDYRTSTSADASRWLSERLKLLQANLKKSEDAVAAYQARNGIVNAGAQGTLDDQQLASLVQQLATATTELAEARARYLQASKNGEPASANNSQSNQFTNLDQLLQEQDRLRRQAAELNQTLGSRHPRVLANAEQQRIISGQVAQERRRLVQRSKQAFETAEAKKQSLERQLADARQRAIVQNKARVALANLEREASANRNLYEQFLERYKVTDEQSNFQFNEARIVSPAPVPIKSTKPSLKLVLPVLLMLGAFLGLLFAMLRQALAAPLPQQVHTNAQALPNDPPLYDSGSVEPPRRDARDMLDAIAARDALAAAEPLAPATTDPLTANLETDLANTAEEDATIEDRGLFISEETQEDSIAFQEEETEPEPEPERAPEMQPADTVVHLDATQPKSRRSARADRIAAATRAREAARAAQQAQKQRPRVSVSSVLMTLPHHDVGSRDRLLDALLDAQQEHLEQFLSPDLEDERLILLVAAAQEGEGREATSDLFREFAIDEGFHPVIIALQDQPEQSIRTMRSGRTAAMPERFARLQEFEGFDQIPFVVGDALLDEEGVSESLASELTSLLTLCAERYGFVIVETEQVVNPAVLEHLIALVDKSVLVLESDDLSAGDLQQWQDWAEENAVGLVLDQTQN